MKRHLASLMVFFVLILTTCSVLASPVEVSIEPESQAGEVYSLMRFALTITNNQDFDDIFQVVFSGPHLEWNMPSIIAKAVPAHSSGETEVVFYPTGDRAGKFDFSISVNSLRNPDSKASAGFTIEVLGDYVKSFSSSVSGNRVFFTAVVQTSEEKIVEGAFTVKDSSGKVVISVPFKETVNGEKTISRSFDPGERLQAGTYTSQVSMGQNTKDYTFTIQPMRSITESVEETPGLLAKEVVVSITNGGNVMESDYALQTKEPLDAITGLLTKPADNCREEGGSMTCDYIVSEIRPGTTAYVTYSVSYWPAFSGYILLAAITLGLVLYSFLHTTTPRIVKNNSRRGEGLHNVFIQISNPFFHRLNDVVVKDSVSPLAQVLHQEIESTIPVIRRLEDGGTELIWKLGEMRPREERVLQYKVRSLINGSLKMPGASLKFSTGKSERKIRLSSNGITLD